MSSTHETVQNILLERQWMARAKQEAAIRALYDKHPELAKMDRGALEIARRRLKERNADTFDEIALLDKDRKRYMRIHNIDPAYGELQPFCKKCNDTGRAGNRFCDCYVELTRKYEKPLFVSVMPGWMNFDTFNYGLFDDGPVRENIREIANKASLYAKHIGQLDEQSRNMFFYGPPGTGKTFMLATIGNTAIVKNERKPPVLFLTARELFDAFQNYRRISQQFKPDEEEKTWVHQQMREIYEVYVLLIDDLGTEVCPRDVSTSELAQLLDRRVERKLHTVIASNMNLEDVAEHYDERIASRLASFLQFRFFGDDLRIKE